MNKFTGNTSIPSCNPSDSKMTCLYMLTTAHILNILLSLPTNVYVLWLIVTGGAGTIAKDFFYLNLSLSDTVYCLSSDILGIAYTFIPIKPIDTAISFFMGLFVTVRALLYCCIGVECYLAVVHPMLFLRFKPLRYRAMCCGVVWVVGLGSCFVCMTVDIWSRVFFYYLMGQSLIYFTLMLFVCLSVLWALKRPGPGAGGVGGNGEERGRDGTNNPMKRKAFNIIVITMTTIVMTYLPIGVIVPLGDYIDINLPMSVAYSFAMACGLVKPFLYLHRTRKIPCILLFTRRDQAPA